MQSKRNEQELFELSGNKIIKYAFRHRLVFVTTAIGFLVIITYIIVKQSLPVDRLKNTILIWTGGSIILGIFYSILNHEYNILKFRFELLKEKISATFSTIDEMGKNETIEHLKNLRAFYNSNKTLAQNNLWEDFDKKMQSDEISRVSYIHILNLYEKIAIGISIDIFDDKTAAVFFKSVFSIHYRQYKGYIEYLRKSNNHPYAFIEYTRLVKKWAQESEY